MPHSRDTVHIADVYPASKRIYGHVLNTPLRQSAWLSEVAGVPVYLKLENLQKTGSFKYRGAVNALKAAQERGVERVVTASAGNHGLGIAEAALATKQQVTVCVPENVSALKLKKLSAYDVEVIKTGNDCEAAEAFARRYADENQCLYISPYNDSDVIAGQGTVALEMLELLPELSTIVVATGGGGLISGMATVVKALNASARVIGVVAANAPSMKAAVEAREIIEVPQLETIADGLAGNIEKGSITFPISQALVDEWISVDEDDIKANLFNFLDHEGMLIEGAAAAAVAAVASKKIQFEADEKLGVVVCGGNIASQTWREIFKQRLS